MMNGLELLCELSSFSVGDMPCLPFSTMTLRGHKFPQERSSRATANVHVTSSSELPSVRCTCMPIPSPDSMGDWEAEILTPSLRAQQTALALIAPYHSTHPTPLTASSTPPSHKTFPTPPKFLFLFSFPFPHQQAGQARLPPPPGKRPHIPNPTPRRGGVW